MDNSIHNVTQIEDYLNDNLSKEDRRLFEEKLENDAQLAADLTAYQQAAKELRNYGLKEELKQYHEILYPSSPSTHKKSSPWPYWIGMAASLILIVIILFVFVSKKPSNESLFTNNFEPYPNLMATRALGFSEIKKGMRFYERQQYDSAIVYLEKVMRDTTFEEILFYSGVSYLAANQTKKAIASFKTLLDSDTLFREQASWYIALAYLRVDEVIQAKKWLYSIRRNQYNFKKAIDLHKTLDS